MNWFDWTLIGLWTLTIVLAPLNINKPRKPRNETDAIVGIVFAGLLIVGMLATRGVLS